MLIMCLFSLSAILAPVLIAIYILQRFMLGKEPTLMVPNWQNWAVKRRTICCLLRGAWSALAPACVCVYACVRVYACVHVHGACMDVCAPIRVSVVCCGRALVPGVHVCVCTLCA